MDQELDAQLGMCVGITCEAAGRVHGEGAGMVLPSYYAPQIYRALTISVAIPQAHGLKLSLKL